MFHQKSYLATHSDDEHHNNCLILHYRVLPMWTSMIIIVTARKRPTIDLNDDQRLSRVFVWIWKWKFDVMGSLYDRMNCVGNCRPEGDGS